MTNVLGIEMGGYLLIFSHDLHDWLKGIPGVTLDYNTIAPAICQVKVSHRQWRESKKSTRDLVANSLSAS